MDITIIGTGYVGLVAGACFADMGNNVICVDSDIDKISKLKKGEIPIYEQGLSDLINSNVTEKRLDFSYDIKTAIKKSKVCFIAVGTPQNKDGSADLQYVFQAAEDIAKSIDNYKIIVNKSTVPVGTGEKIIEIIRNNTEQPFDYVSNPEFLKQGNAVNDFLYPERIIIGSDSNNAISIMRDIYSSFFRVTNRIMIMDIKSAEMTKYVANSFLATKISFMNEIANLCEKIGVDVEKVRMGISADSRIGNKFLFAGLGYGGSCFPKDIKALINMGLDNNCEMSILKSVDEVNIKQRQIFINKITERFGSDLKGFQFGILGLAFKPKTNDVREAPSITIINELVKKGAEVKVFDPKAIVNAKLYFRDRVVYCKNMYETLENSDAMILLTEWNEFRKPDFEKIKQILKQPIIFDGRNQYDKEKMSEFGFEYFCVGK